MTCRYLTVRSEIWPLKEVFHISRGVKTQADVIVAELEQGVFRGRGEAVPYARYGETIESVTAQIKAVAAEVEGGVSPERLLEILPAGAARNAVDCALWDIICREQETPLWELLDLPRPRGMETAVTISIGSAETMAEKASVYKDYPLLKIKLDDQDIKARITAIRQAAPNPRIIIDPNESWTMQHLRGLDSFLHRMKIDLLEQPLAAGQDGDLADFNGKIPICADESCHTREDLAGLVGKYQVVNIKLDKTGGLTEAMSVKKQAEAMGFDIMVGCMVSTSLAMAPALLLAHDVAFVDLDGPILIKEDREYGLNLIQGYISGLSPELWGG